MDSGQHAAQAQKGGEHTLQAVRAAQTPVCWHNTSASAGSCASVRPTLPFTFHPHTCASHKHSLSPSTRAPFCTTHNCNKLTFHAVASSVSMCSPHRPSSSWIFNTLPVPAYAALSSTTWAYLDTCSLSVLVIWGWGQVEKRV